jgi:hypothetical protein
MFAITLPKQQTVGHAMENLGYMGMGMLACWGMHAGGSPRPQVLQLSETMPKASESEGVLSLAIPPAPSSGLFWRNQIRNLNLKVSFLDELNYIYYASFPLMSRSLSSASSSASPLILIFSISSYLFSVVSPFLSHIRHNGERIQRNVQGGLSLSPRARGH